MDRDTLETLVRAHQAQIYRYLRYLGADSVSAEDLVQDVFLAAFKSEAFPGSEEEPKAAAWLRGIARNLFLQHCRRAGAARVKTNTELVERAEDVWKGHFLREGDGFDYAEALRKCLEELPKTQRAALEMRYERQKSRLQMARRLKMTQNGVKSLLRRIRTALAGCVRRRLALEDV